MTSIPNLLESRYRVKMYRIRLPGLGGLAQLLVSCVTLSKLLNAGFAQFLIIRQR